MVKEKKTKRRTKVKTLPKKEKRLSKAEQEQIKGGDLNSDYEIRKNYFLRFPVAKSN